MNENNKESSADILGQLFSDNRAEWPAARFKDLFVSPTYLAKLQAKRPCFLVGGRGTGKTTSLQSLRYDSALERIEAAGDGFADQRYVGVFVRMNKNRVRAFSGEPLNETNWGRYFVHYFNLLVCSELLDLTRWLERQTGIMFGEDYVSAVGAEFGELNIKELSELKTFFKRSISQLQIQVNNPNRDYEIVASMAESPLRVFATALSESGLLGERTIFCCIDEYENLFNYQQAVINTYIKHAEPPLSYKVGVRKNGIRNRCTLDSEDLLRTPDDYAEIEIADEGFEYFAKEVAETRLRYAKSLGVDVPIVLREFLGELSFQQEAEALGADRIAKQVIEELAKEEAATAEYFSTKPAHETYFLKYWQESDRTTLISLARSWMTSEGEWKTRLGNYGYSSLFWLSRGNKGARIRKYYCGERVFLALSSGNIRYFLELIDTAIQYEIKPGDTPSRRLVITPKSQTYAARDVGGRRLSQLEGLAEKGVQLKRLVLAIGKVFFELARAPLGRTPEVTSFVLSGRPSDIDQVAEILADGVAHLAFEADPRTKSTSNAEMKDDEYRLHPIFCAFFEISHRKKRRTSFNARYLLDVIEESPSRAISAMLEGDPQVHEDDLPEQLALFSAFYEGGK